MTLELKHVTKRFQALTAISELSLKFEPGLIYGVIGPNGAGKSTLVNLVSGTFPPTEGQIALGRTDIHRLAPNKVSLAGIARTYQNVRLFDRLSARDNLEVCFYPTDKAGVWKEVLLPSYKRWKDSERRGHCDRMLQVCGIEEYAETPASLLPYGRQRILEIARALMRDPRVLLLDEPAAGLNHHETSDLRDRLKSLKHPDRIMIVIEHDMEMVMSLCDRIFVLNFGKLLFEGTPAEVQASELVKDAYLGTDDELDAIRAAAKDRKARGGLRAHADPRRH